VATCENPADSSSLIIFKSSAEISHLYRSWLPVSSWESCPFENFWSSICLLGIRLMVDTGPWTALRMPWRTRKETSPGAVEFHPYGWREVSSTDLRLHMKNCRPWTDESIASLAKVSQCVLQAPSRVLCEPLCTRGAWGKEIWAPFIVRPGPFNALMDSPTIIYCWGSDAGPWYVSIPFALPADKSGLYLSLWTPQETSIWMAAGNPRECDDFRYFLEWESVQGP
jgi:hypothetical protein